MNALITGATKGIGRAITFQLAKNNYNLFLCARNADELEMLRSELSNQFSNLDIYALPTDCANQSELNHFTDFVQQHVQALDVLINNAGLYIPSKLLDEDEDTLSRQMQVNLYAAHYLCKVFGKQMREAGAGHIINICSVAGVKPFANAGSYSVTKFALLGLTKVLREELMQFGVKVTAVLPGSTLTNSWAGTSLPPDRFVRAKDVADAIMSCLKMSKGANMDEIVIRPVLGEII